MPADDLFDPVLLVNQNDSRLIACRLRFLELRVSNDYDFIPNRAESGCWSIQANHPGTCFSRDYVSFKSLTVVYVNHLNLLIRQNSGCVEQVAVYGEASLIIKLGLCNSGSVNLGFT